MKCVDNESLQEKMSSGTKVIMLTILKSGYFIDSDESQIFLANAIMDAVELGMNCTLERFSERAKELTA